MNTSANARRNLTGIAVVVALSALAMDAQSDRELTGTFAGELAGVFAWPGTTLWWLVAGGPFQTLPATTRDTVEAIVANTIFWCATFWLIRLALRHFAGKQRRRQ